MENQQVRVNSTCK